MQLDLSNFQYYNITMKKLNSIPFKNRLVLSYSMVLALVLIIGAIFYSFSYHQVERGINEQAVSSLSSSVRQVDNILTQINSSALRVVSNSLLQSLFNSDGKSDDFSYTAYQAQVDLKPILPLEQFLSDSSLFLYMGNSNYMISSKSLSDFDLIVKYHPEYAELVSQSPSLGLMDPLLWRRFIPLSDSSDVSQDYLYISPINSSIRAINGNIHNVLCLRVGRSTLETYFSDVTTRPSYDILAYNGDGNEVFSLDSKTAQIPHETLSELSYQNGTAKFRFQGTEMVSVSVVSDYSGWTFYSVQPASQLYYSADSYQNMAIIIAILTFLVEFLFIYLFSIYNSKPVDRLSHELATKESLAFSLTALVEKHKPLIAESYTRKLMEGNITTNESMAYIIDEMKLNRPDCQYQVLYTEVSPSDSIQPHITDLKLCIQNYDILVKDALRRYFPDTGYIYKPSDQVFACLVTVSSSLSDAESRSQNIEQFQLLHHELLTKYGIWINGGFGEKNEIVSYIWKSCQQAKNAKSITTRERYILSYSDFLASADNYYFPESLAVQLSGFISTGSKPQVESVFKQLKEENLERRSLSYTQLKWLIADVQSTVFRKRRSIDVSLIDTEEKSELLDLIDRQFEGEIGLKNLETISLELCDLYGSGSESNELIIKIQEYIINNYMDSALSLTRISEEFHISENYFSYLFKKEVSENFSTYLETLRMAKAKELVTESDTSISELYQYIGYNNASSFRRVFKKNFGVSPREMRDKMNVKVTVQR